MTLDEFKALVDVQAQALKDAADSLPKGGDQQAQIDALTLQVADLQSKVDAGVASLSAEIAKEADLQAQKDQSDAKIAKALADLQGA